MIFSSHKKIALGIAAVASAGTGILFLTVSIAYPHIRFWVIPVACIAVFVAVYSVSVHLLNRLIFEKINPIYKTIYNLSLPFKRFKKLLNRKGFMNELHREVQFWADKQIQEIDRLKEMEEYRKEFLGNVSHELKTPIFNIQGYVLTLLDGALNEPAVNRQYLEKTEKSINRLISVVEDLESISRLETKTLSMNLEKLNLVRLVEEIFEAQELRAKERGIKLQFDREYDRQVLVNADRKRIFQALSNLIINSIFYGRDGGKTIVSFLDLDDCILTEVKDNGIGIARKDIPRIFERFYRADKSRSREQGGTGLGLAIVKHIIEAHNQSISVRSTKNKGTLFAFTLTKYKS